MTRITQSLEAPLPLSTYFPNPPPETRRSQRVTAVVNRTEERLAALFQEFLTRQEEALTIIAEGQDLIAAGTISDRDRESIILLASKRHRFAVVRALLASGPISDAVRGNVVYDASRDGHFAMVQALLASGPILSYHRGNALYYASKDGYFAMVQALLASGPILSYHRGNALYYASRQGHFAIVRALLASGPISDEDRGNAFREASGQGRLDIVQALGKGTFLSHLCAVKDSLSHGHFQTAARLSLAPAAAIGLTAIALYQAYAYYTSNQS